MTYHKARTNASLSSTNWLRETAARLAGAPLEITYGQKCHRTASTEGKGSKISAFFGASVLPNDALRIAAATLGQRVLTWFLQVEKESHLAVTKCEPVDAPPVY
jgi:hypothetical protein